jgi:hypothetical protein
MVCWVLARCRLAGRCQCSEKHTVLSASSALKMETVCFSERWHNRRVYTAPKPRRSSSSPWKPQISLTWIYSHCRIWGSNGGDYPNDGGSKYLWNFGKLLPDYTAQQPRRQPSSYSHSSLLGNYCRINNKNNSCRYFIITVDSNLVSPNMKQMLNCRGHVQTHSASEFH